MSKPILLLVFGPSRAGKDELANVANKFNFNTIHPIADLKRFLEEHFSCPNLDTVEGKSHVPCKGTDLTMQDIMVKLYHFWESLGIPFSYFHIKSVLERAAAARSRSLILAIRSNHELVAIEEFQEHFTIVTIIIKRPGCVPISTDHLQEEIAKAASKISTHVYHLGNNGCLEQWQLICKDLFVNIDKMYG